MPPPSRPTSRQSPSAHAGNERELRTAFAQRLKAALVEGRAAAEQLLLKDRHGRRCAERLCLMQDEIIRLLFEFAGKHLYPSQNPSEAEHMAIVATGGYGRGLLAPGSDIDLLFLLPYKQTAWGESIAEAILYCLWDMGLKVGHATRSVNECIRQAKADMTIRTAILEARFLLGERKLYDELVTRFDKEVVQGTAARIRRRQARRARGAPPPRRPVALSGRAQRQGRQGRPARPAHAVLDRQIRLSRARARGADRARRVRPRTNTRCSAAASDFLWAVRCHMHFVTGRAEERLSFDIQREIAVRLGYTAHPGLRDVERFMKHYFLIAKDVGDLTAILCAELEDTPGQGDAGAQPHDGAASGRAAAQALTETDDFIVDNNRINVADPDVFKRDPVNLIRIFHLAQKHNLAFHPDAMRVATRSLKLIDAKLRENEEANRCSSKSSPRRTTPRPCCGG